MILVLCSLVAVASAYDEARAVSGYQSIQVNGTIMVTLNIADHEGLVASTPNPLVNAELVSEVRNGVLSLSFRGDVALTATVVVNALSITSLTTSGSRFVPRYINI